mmetsp:Transcript_44799/g.59494  ORF Transcript_44799/g.59494 Transcript_44799/m.59494 type:complete len:325 (-) Transcript_44799:719-1693(-)
MLVMMVGVRVGPASVLLPIELSLALATMLSMALPSRLFDEPRIYQGLFLDLLLRGLLLSLASRSRLLIVGRGMRLHVLLVPRLCALCCGLLLLLVLQLLAQLLFLLEGDLLSCALLLMAPLLLQVFPLANLRDDAQGCADREGVVADEAGDGLPAVVDLGHLNQHGNVVEEASILRVVIPRNDGQTALRLQHVGGGRVVDDDRIFHVPADLGHVLHEDAVDEGAVLAEEPRCAVALGVHLVHQGVRILGKRGRVNDHFIILGHLLQEVLRARSLHHVNIGGASIDVDRDRVVGVPHLVELTMNESFIEVEYESFPTPNVLRLRA